MAFCLWLSGRAFAVPPARISKLRGHRYGAGFGWDQPSERNSFDANTWNTLEVEAMKNLITTSIDGKKIAEFTDNDAWFQSGAIA